MDDGANKMNYHNLLIAHLLDFLFEINQKGIMKPLIVGGGLGLFLKRQYVTEKKIRTLFDNPPFARSTEDIDLFVPLEVLCNLEQWKKIYEVLNLLEYKPVKGREYMQWEKSIQINNFQEGRVKIDWLTGPYDEQSEKYLHIKEPRIRPKGESTFHAHLTEEALLIDDKKVDIPFVGKRTNEAEYETIISVPHPFTYLLMKLFAYNDRQNDERKFLGQHHAFDIFEIIGLLTENELSETIQLGKEYAENVTVQKARQITQNYFNGLFSRGSLKIQTNQLFAKRVDDLEQFLNVIAEIFPPIST
jgi:hypothetical protein